MWRSYWRCDALQRWSLSVPIWTSNIAKRSIGAIFIRRDYFTAHGSTMAGDNRQTVVLKEEHTVGGVGVNLSRNTGDKHGTWKTLFLLLYHINFLAFFFCRTGRQSQAYKCLVWLHLGLCVAVATRTLKILTEKGKKERKKNTPDERGDCAWAGWDGIMSDILWNLYLQSRVFFHANETRLIRICLMGHMQNMRQLIPSLVFHRADWQRPERASRRACLQKPNIDLFNGVRESKITNLLSIVYEAV